MAAAQRGAGGARGASHETTSGPVESGADQKDELDRGELRRGRSAGRGTCVAVAGQRLPGEAYGSPPAGRATSLFRSADRGVAVATGGGQEKADRVHQEPRCGDGSTAARSGTAPTRRRRSQLPPDSDGDVGVGTPSSRT